MPLFFQQHINGYARLAVWRIGESEDFFRGTVGVETTVTHPQKRLQHLAGRYLLRHLYPDFPVEDIRIADSRKPYLPDDAYRFSISHCGDFAAAVVGTESSVGVDVEMGTPRIRRIVPKFLHADERVWMDSVNGPLDPPSQDPADLARFILPTLLWSVKESVFKWHGEGGVDFSEHIRILPFAFGGTGSIEVRFLKGVPQLLNVSYRIFDGLCLSWVVGE